MVSKGVLLPLRPLVRNMLRTHFAFNTALAHSAAGSFIQDPSIAEFDMSKRVRFSPYAFQVDTGELVVDSSCSMPHKAGHFWRFFSLYSPPPSVPTHLTYLLWIKDAVRKFWLDAVYRILIISIIESPTMLLRFKNSTIVYVLYSSNNITKYFESPYGVDSISLTTLLLTRFSGHPLEVFISSARALRVDLAFSKYAQILSLVVRMFSNDLFT